MQRLILMRHGEAERPAAGVSDFDRGLTQDGRAESRLVGRALADAGLDPDLALVSPALRALETWRAVAESFNRPAEEHDASLYAASAVRLAAGAREAAPRARTLIMVGHNPGMHQFAIHLAIQAGASEAGAKPLFERFPTATAAVFAIDADGRPAFERLFLARDHRGDAG